MSVQASDLKHREAANLPMDDTSTVGGAKTASDVGSGIGAVFHTRTAAPTEAGDTQYQYKKTFLTNINEDTDLTEAKVYLTNALAAVSENGIVSVASSSADDDSDYKIKVVGEDGDSYVITEEITMDGTSAANGSSTFSKIFWVELRLVANNALTTANGIITITRGSALGVIPTGEKCAMSIVDIGLVGTLDDSGTSTDATTAPESISFSRPSTFATGIEVANSGTLTAESGQGVWWRQTIEGGLKPAADLEIKIAILGGTA